MHQVSYKQFVKGYISNIIFGGKKSEEGTEHCLRVLILFGIESGLFTNPTQETLHSQGNGGNFL